MYNPAKYLLIKMQTLDTFNELIANLNDPRSSDTEYAMRMLNIHPNDIPTLIGLRMQYHQYPFFNSVNRFMFNQAESEKNEIEFAATVPSLDPNVWVAFVTKTREAVQNAQQQEQQQQEQEQQQQQMHDDNWKRIIGKLSNCDTDTQRLSQHLNVPCVIFIKILVERGKALNDSVYSDQLNGDDETRFVNEVVNPMLSKINPPLMVDPVKWIDVIEYLRVSLRSQYQQPDASFEDQDYSRRLESSLAPSSGRPTPITRRSYPDVIPSVPDKKLDTINTRIVAIFNTPPAVFTDDEDVDTPEYNIKYQYYILISNFLNTHKPPIITSEEHALLFGDVQHTSLRPAFLLLKLFNERFPDLNAEESFAFACRAYLDANPNTISFLISLEERNPKTLYVIARLMHSFATNVFNRNFGKNLGGKSRSKKRGRKSVHRRKKSMHKKRK